MNLAKASAAENTFLFEHLLQDKDKIEAAFGAELEWLSLEGKKSCRIQYSKEADGFTKEKWPEWVAWHLEHMSRLEEAMKAPLQKAGEALKKANLE